jgi:hypothetical protein
MRKIVYRNSLIGLGLKTIGFADIEQHYTGKSLIFSSYDSTVLLHADAGGCDSFQT